MSTPSADANLNDALVQQGEVAPTRKQDCLSCRIVGTGTFATVGGYALWQSRAAAPGSPGQKKIVGGLGVALLVGGVIRWFQ